MVINYDYPNNSEDYVHRIGRTGRRDKKVRVRARGASEGRWNKSRLQGVAHTFFTSSNAPKARDLIKVLEEAGQTVPPELAEMANSGAGRGGGGGGRGSRPRFSGKRPGDAYGSGANDIAVKRGRTDNGYGGGSSGGYGAPRW